MSLNIKCTKISNVICRVHLQWPPIIGEKCHSDCHHSLYQDDASVDFGCPSLVCDEMKKIAKAIIVVRSARVDQGISYLLTRFANLQWGGATATALMTIRHHICQIFYTSTVSGFWKLTRKKRVNRDILNLKYYIFGAFTHSIGVICIYTYMFTKHIING